MRDDSQQFGAVIAATDAVSARDPNRVVIDGPAEPASTNHIVANEVEANAAGA
jgi:hypothetical protein